MVAPEPKDLPVFSKFEHNDADMKVWLPQGLIERLDWISKHEDVSRPAVIRALLYEHLYGRVAYKALLIYSEPRKGEKTLMYARGRAGEGTGIERMTAAIVAEESGVRFSTERSISAELIGAPTDNLRLELPRRMKDDLVKVAGIHGLPPSKYVRKALVLQLQGELAHADWQAAIGRIGRDIEILEQDD